MKKTMLLAIALALPAILLAGDYKTTNLQNVIPSAINKSGQVAATVNISGAPRAVLWTRTGGAQDLGTLGGSSAMATAINEAGQIAGRSALPADAATHAFRWTSAEGMQDLGTPAGTLSYAVAINERGEVAGEWLDPVTQKLLPFVWSPGTGLVDLGSPLGGTTFVTGFNGAGHVALTAVSANNLFSRAYLWTPQTGAVELDTGGNASSRADGVSDLDDVVGNAGNHAALWRPGAQIQDLGTLGGLSSEASLVNSSGTEVRGFSLLSGGKQTHSFRWTASNGLEDLGHLAGHPNSNPVAMNSSGATAGSDSGTYVWSQAAGMRAIGVMANPYGLNDAGQVIGVAKKNPAQGLLATPVIKVDLVSSLNPCHAGQSVTLTATLTSVAGAPPDGEVIKFLDGATLLGSAPLSGGVASLTTSSLVPGTHSLKAKYPGEANYFGAASAVLKQVVNP